MGFGTHGHDNMEIVTIPLRGTLAHKDSLGSEGFIKPGEVQIMSAGKGIRHSEYNGSATEEVNLFQIWVFPKVRNIEPRYDQKAFDAETWKGKFKTLVSPAEEDGAMWINQDAFFSRGDFEAEKSTYTIKHPGNGAYVMVVEGEAEIAGQSLSRRDAIGVFDTESFDIDVKGKASLLVVEVPME
jgi:redox-sensitive bicupin YhaK (pirin superfamily)